MGIKPYRIKHKPTGLYYQPSQNGTNLSTKGKVYLTRKSPLTINGGIGRIWISVRQDSEVFRKYHSILGIDIKGNATLLWKHTQFIPKSEFEQEFLEL